MPRAIRPDAGLTPIQVGFGRHPDVFPHDLVFYILREEINGISRPGEGPPG